MTATLPADDDTEALVSLFIDRIDVIDVGPTVTLRSAPGPTPDVPAAVARLEEARQHLAAVEEQILTVGRALTDGDLDTFGPQLVAAQLQVAATTLQLTREREFAALADHEAKTLARAQARDDRDRAKQVELQRDRYAWIVRQIDNGTTAKGRDSLGQVAGAAALHTIPTSRAEFFAAHPELDEADFAPDVVASWGVDDSGPRTLHVGRLPETH